MLKKDRVKKATNIINKAKKLGLDLDKITDGKSIEKLSYNKLTLKNLEKRFKRQKEQPKLKQEVKKIDEKIQERKRVREEEKKRKWNRERISKESKAIAKWNLGFDEQELKQIGLKEKTREESKEFLDRYFKQISLDKKAQRKINKLTKRFGNRIDIMYDFMDFVSQMEFKYEIEREIMKTETPDEFNQMMYERLDMFDRILKKDFNI